MQKRMKRKKNEKGFTLVELLATIVILGIIAAIAVPMIGNVIQDTRDKAVLADAQQILNAAKLKYTSDVETSNKTYQKTATVNDLEGYIEGIPSTATYTVEYIAAEKNWTIIYSEMTKEDTKKRLEDNFDTSFESDGSVDATNINLALKGGS